MVRFSICIPTFNRGPFLAELLESILDQGHPEVEVVISDNASTDDTSSVVDAYRGRFRQFVWHRWPVNMGADANFAKVISLASGEHCWFMGSDDALLPGSIDAIFADFEKFGRPAGASVNWMLYDRQLSRPLKAEPAITQIGASSRLFTDGRQAFYSLAEYLGYIPSLIFAKAEWENAARPVAGDNFYNYLHVYVAAKILENNRPWLFVSHPCLKWRADNDSFLVDGFYRRFEIDVRGYTKIIEMTFARDRWFQKKVMDKICRVIICAAIPQFAFREELKSDVSRTLDLCFRHLRGYSAFWTWILPWLLLAQTRIVRVLRPIWRALKPWFKASPDG